MGGDASPLRWAETGPGGRRRQRRAARLVLLACVTLPGAIPSLLSAQASPPLPLDDPAYALMDRVLSALPLPSSFHGQRPWTRRRFALLVREARDARPTARADPPPLSTPSDAVLDALLATLEERFAEDLALLDGADPGASAPLDRMSLEATLADSPSRGFRPTPAGSLDDAAVNPLAGSRFGRELADGATLALESEHHLRISPRLVAFGGPRLALHLPRGGERDADLLLRTGALRGTAGGWALQVGRAELRRGQGRHAGALRSDQPPSLDMVLLESEEPFRLPWVLDALGPATFSVFLADLGEDQNFPGATLFGSWLGLRPSRALEIGAGYVVQSGGRGSPEQSVWERVGDHLILVDLLFQSGGEFQASNKVAGFEARLTLPGVVAWGEWTMDDLRGKTWRRVGETLWTDAAHVFGVSLPRLPGAGALSGWVEYRHTGIRMYRHAQFTSGLTQEGYLVGDPLGPDAHALAAGLELWGGARSVFALEVARESRSQDAWTAEGDPFHFVKAEDGPEEERYRVQLRWDRRLPRGGPGWRVEAGGERVESFDFQEGRDEWNALLALSVEWARR